MAPAGAAPPLPASAVVHMRRRLALQPVAPRRRLVAAATTETVESPAAADQAPATPPEADAAAAAAAPAGAAKGRGKFSGIVVGRNPATQAILAALEEVGEGGAGRRNRMLSPRNRMRGAPRLSALQTTNPLPATRKKGPPSSHPTHPTIPPTNPSAPPPKPPPDWPDRHPQRGRRHAVSPPGYPRAGRGRRALREGPRRSAGAGVRPAVAPRQRGAQPL